MRIHEPVWRQIYNEIAATQAEYPRRCGTSAEIRGNVENLLYQWGYRGKYPDFIKCGEVRGLHANAAITVKKAELLKMTKEEQNNNGGANLLNLRQYRIAFKGFRCGFFTDIDVFCDPGNQFHRVELGLMFESD